MDALDIKIIRSLNKNARKSFRELGRELKISMATVSNRIKKLEERGIIKGYIPLIDFEKIGYDLTAVISVRLKTI